MLDRKSKTIISDIKQLIADNNLTMVPIEVVNLLIEMAEQYEILLDLKDEKIAQNEDAIKAVLSLRRTPYDQDLLR